MSLSETGQRGRGLSDYAEPMRLVKAIAKWVRAWAAERRAMADR